MRYTLAISMVVLCLLATGCAPGVRPSVSVIDAVLIDQTEEATVVDFVLRASNPGDVPIPLREFEYALSLDGVNVFSSRRAAEATLRAHGTQTILLPVVIRHLPERPALSGDHQYRFSGRLTFVESGEFAEVLHDTGMRVPAVRFAQTGRLKIP